MSLWYILGVDRKHPDRARRPLHKHECLGSEYESAIEQESSFKSLNFTYRLS